MSLSLRHERRLPGVKGHSNVILQMDTASSQSSTHCCPRKDERRFFVLVNLIQHMHRCSGAIDSWRQAAACLVGSVCLVGFETIVFPEFKDLDVWDKDMKIGVSVDKI